ncbi:peptidylprolyl isomerase [Catenuloplanes japonicus]|uniref:peptidylprolyl isomerase n=1 Tax=Catenuloplanes japonicus TaxID=33876 RepID=UPI000AA607DC|nr:peptidylprolyl isomerase [Catenuloplanes japonicus]
MTGFLITSRPSPIATVAGTEVTRDELLFHMRRLAPTVQNELGLTGPWDRAATDTLADRALTEIKADRALLTLAREQGLVTSVDHTGFLRDLAAENRRRAESTEVVYGLTEFTAEEFWSHRRTALTTQVEQRLSRTAGDPLWVTDDEVRAAYDADPDSWNANATTYAYRKLVVPVVDDAAAASLRQRVADAATLKDITADGAVLTTGTLDGGATTGLNTPDQDLHAVLTALQPGEISAPVAGAGQVTYYELDGRTVDEQAAYADYSRRIRQSLVEQRLGRLLQHRADSGEFVVDDAALAAINPEDVQ